MDRSRYPGHQGPDVCFDFMSFPLSLGCGSLLHSTSLPSTLFMFFSSRSDLFPLSVFIHPPLWVFLCSSFPWEGSHRKKSSLFAFALSLHPESQLLPTSGQRSRKKCPEINKPQAGFQQKLYQHHSGLRWAGELAEGQPEKQRAKQAGPAAEWNFLSPLWLQLLLIFGNQSLAVVVSYHTVIIFLFHSFLDSSTHLPS